MDKLKIKNVCVLLVMLCLFGSSVLAATTIKAVESCRTNIETPDENREHNQRLPVDGSEGDGSTDADESPREQLPAGLAAESQDPAESLLDDGSHSAASAESFLVI